MERYTPETMSRRDMKKCYSRYSICVLLSIAASQGLAILLVIGAERYLPGLLEGNHGPIWQILINDVSVYLPALILIPPLLRRLPKAEPIPVNQLSLWELLQGAAFSLGIGYLFSLLTNLFISLLENLTGFASSNVVDSLSDMPPMVYFLSVAVVAPVLEELTYRKLLLERLRGLGDRSAVLLSALAFALFHANLYQTVYAFALGAVFACVVLLTGSIRDTILLHMCVNGLSVVITYCDFPYADQILGAAIYLLIGISIAQLILSRGKYHLEDGPLPFRRSEKLRACLHSVWFWLLLLGGLGLSAVSIFL